MTLKSGRVLEISGRSWRRVKDGVLEMDQKLVFGMIASWLDFNLWLSNIIANILDNIKD
jgi:hypothetical protein